MVSDGVIYDIGADNGASARLGRRPAAHRA